MNGLVRIVRVGSIAILGVVSACSPKGRAGTEPRVAASSTTPGSSAACAQICEASAACGDSPTTCETRCTEWLVRRSRPGIADVTAKCAVPRIDTACEQEASRVAARALVSCVDEAGRQALRRDKSTLLVAARAICERGARCGGGSAKDAAHCVSRIAAANPTPRGLGIFGAIRPELVDNFASCMQSSQCGPGAALCFGEMLGENGLDDGDGPPEVDEAPTTPPPVEGGTKI